MSTRSLSIWRKVPGYFSAAWCNERLDRPRTVAIYLVGAAVSALALSQLDTSAAIVATGALLSFFLNGVYAGLYAYTPEVFPTWVRATGTGLSVPELTEHPGAEHHTESWLGEVDVGVRVCLKMGRRTGRNPRRRRLHHH